MLLFLKDRLLSKFFLVGESDLIKYRIFLLFVDFPLNVLVRIFHG